MPGILTSYPYPKPGVLRGLEVRLQALQPVVPPRAPLPLKPELAEVEGHLVHQDDRRVGRQLEEVYYLGGGGCRGGWGVGGGGRMRRTSAWCCAGKVIG